ncbi:PAS sensor-containing two-component system histidine kinase [Arcobacter venerupis]|uniref:histidine kinase n=1 Tax=Arcobacter venerupis TaxID=1054033 RepID=A0AAE7BAK0_9BACT|nr:PAS domain-containing sensor histidine kinase [Arcobacter venerupis]QKF66725.1 PAS sensor-containing two-component system histidine kinase [Arcobacter venerupis]RWS48159.1 hypothetical protein CKA56_15470 [Arcobacter venerupis]
MKQNHYLKTEFYEKIKKDSIIFDFLEENSLDGVWYWDLENPQNEWMSPKFWQVLGYLPEEKEHLSSQWQEIIFPEDLKKATENFYKHYENPNYPYDQIVRYKHKKGHTIWVRCRGNIIRDDHGKPIRMIGVHNDITEEKYFQEKLEQKVEEEIKKRFKQERLLVQQSKMATMGEMMAAIAHNWRQPLNTISLLSASITKKLLNSKLTKDYIDNWIIKMNNQVNFMSQTIDDFRNFYKPEEKFKEVSLKKIILKVISLISLQLKINNIKIEVNIQEPILLVCLENQLQQALINVLINSKEAILNKNIKNGMILLNAKKDDSFVNLIIQDNGGGIENEENFTSIFEPYFTTKANSHGTGIGLYMTKIIIEQNMKGKIETKNINNGFEFTIKIPI